MLSSEGSGFFRESKWIKKIIELLFRIALGGALFIKGVDFVRNKVVLRKVISETDFLQNIPILELAIPWIHILGGLFIAIGLYTRIAIYIQIPIISGAIFVLWKTKNSSFQSPEMIFAIIILILLLIYLKFGDGFYSWRNLIHKERDIV